MKFNGIRELRQWADENGWIIYGNSRYTAFAESKEIGAGIPEFPEDEELMRNSGIDLLAWANKYLADSQSP